ncbi:MAG TPA: ABC transporter permease subunit [Pirellulales bacterium]|nr:ABC transporter permease subunit [Pirellulales bacterium]
MSAPLSSGTIPTPAAATPATAAPARWRRRRTSLSAHGEPMVWLTGGALVAALAMIVGLLGWVFFEGVTTFWPAPVVLFKTLDGKAVLGEVARTEEYQPEPSAFEHYDSPVAAQARAKVEAAGGKAERRLLRTGNFELTNTHFELVPDFFVASQEFPPWALVVERMTWGRFYGWPSAFVLDGKTVAETPEETWARFSQYHAAVRSRAAQRDSLEEQIGRINGKLSEEQLRVRAVELHNEPDSPERAEAQRRLAEVQADADQRISALRQEIQALERENARYEMQMTTAQGQRATLALAEIVRAYPANQLGFGGKLSVYGSRWLEFLTQKPREANSEGGVFPAIFGTVVMTLVMTLAVVPFGVLGALYMREYARAGLIVSAVRIAINNLAGVPSIVFGVFGLGFFCYSVGGYIDGGSSNPWQPPAWCTALGLALATLVAAIAASAAAVRRGIARPRVYSSVALGLWLAAAALAVTVLATNPYFHGFFEARRSEGSPTFGKGGLLWASLTLALLTLPVVIVATEEALAAVPRSMREGSFACGASKWQTIWRIVLPRAMPGIMTGMILAMARGAGEVAPLMLVGAVKLAPELPLDSSAPFLHPERSFMHLGFHIFDLGFQSPNSDAAKPMVFTTTLLLIAIIAVLNIAAVKVRSRLSRRFASNQF